MSVWTELEFQRPRHMTTPSVHHHVAHHTDPLALPHQPQQRPVETLEMLLAAGQKVFFCGYDLKTLNHTHNNIITVSMTPVLETVPLSF